MNKKTVLITGVNGFIGTHLAKVLSDTFPDIRLIGLSRSGKRRDHETVVVDLLDKAATLQIVRDLRPAYIFHMAGLISSSNFDELYSANVVSTINLLESAKQTDSRLRVIIPGSAAEYGQIRPNDLPVTEMQLPNPISPYGVTKSWQTIAARYYALNGVDVVIGRVFNVIGREAPASLSIGAFAIQLNKIRRGETAPRIMVGNLSPRRDFIDISDVCKGLIALAIKGTKGEIYNIGCGASLSTEAVLKMMIEQTGLTIEIKSDATRVKHLDIEDIYCSTRKITAETGWRPVVTLRESIECMMKEFQSD